MANPYHDARGRFASGPGGGGGSSRSRSSSPAKRLSGGGIQNYSQMTNSDKIKAAETMFGTNSKQYKAAKKRFG
jgi:hypothetical protein